MRKRRGNWLLLLPVLFIMNSCFAPTSISDSVSCSGYMYVQNSRYKKEFLKKREHLIRENAKYQRKKKNEY